MKSDIKEHDEHATPQGLSSAESAVHERLVMFTISPNEATKIAEWKSDHDCTITAMGAVGGKLTYKFTPTTLGVCSKIECACGAEFDFTEYESW